MKEIGKGGLMEQIRLHLGKKPDLVLFRCQSGSVNTEEDPKKPPRWVTYGLHPGASDLIGCLTTTAGVGKFFALEIKAPGKKPTAEQMAFIELIRKFKGYGGWCNSLEGAEECYRLAGGKHLGGL